MKRLPSTTVRPSISGYSSPTSPKLAHQTTNSNSSLQRNNVFPSQTFDSKHFPTTNSQIIHPNVYGTKLSHCPSEGGLIGRGMQNRQHKNKPPFVGTQVESNYNEYGLKEKKVNKPQFMKKKEFINVVRKVKKVVYTPQERQIIHYPQQIDNRHSQSKQFLLSQGISVKNDALYKPMDSRLLYTYSSKAENTHSPVGYIEDGNRRLLSNSSVGGIKKIKSMELLPSIMEFRAQENSKIGQENSQIYD